MEERVPEALFEKFVELDQLDPFFYSSAVLYTKAMCRFKKDNEMANFIETISSNIPPTHLNLWTLQTIYSSILYGASGLLNSKIKIKGVHFSAIELGECLNNFYELVFEVFMSLYFEEAFDFGIKDEYEEKQESIIKGAAGAVPTEQHDAATQ